MGKEGYKRRLPFLRRGINATSLFICSYWRPLEAEIPGQPPPVSGRKIGNPVDIRLWEKCYKFLRKCQNCQKMLQILKKMFDIVLKNGIFVPLEPREGPPSRPRAGPPSRASCRRGNPASTSRCSRGHRAGTPAGFPFSGFVPFSSIFSRICNIFLRICNRFLRKCQNCQKLVQILKKVFKCQKMLQILKKVLELLELLENVTNS